jgi:hypothetical protein
MSLENQREEYSVLEKKGKYLIKYEKILGRVSRNCEELLKILQGKLCVTKQFAVCLISMTFIVEKSKKKEKKTHW